MNENSGNRQSRLSATKHLLLQKWKQGQITVAPQDSQAIPHRRQYNPVPLSFAQQRLWFIDQLVSGNRAYNVSLSIQIHGSLSVNALQDSLNMIVQRHEVLRTTFPVIDGQPMQFITPSLALLLPVIDLQVLSKVEMQAIAQRLVVEEANYIFDLSQGPLIRFKLLRLSEDDHILFLLLHHTICDGWSLGNLDQELWLLYSAFLHGRHSPLPELPIQYADFAVWQRQRLQGEFLESELTYWRQALADAPSLLQLPTDRSRPSIQTFHGTHHIFELSEGLTELLRVLNRSTGTTMFMALLAAFQLLLSYYSGQHDILVGCPIANRQRVETEKLIGFFVSTLVLRTDLTTCGCFRDLLSRVREVTLGAYAHQDVPFEQLVAELQIERDMSRNPLFQVMFNYGSEIPLQPVTPPNLVLEVTNVNGGTAMFDLWVSMWEENNKLKGIVEFNTDLFDLSTIQRMLGHFQHLLDTVTANPDRPLDFSILTLTERQQIVANWNLTEKVYSQGVQLQQLFEAQVSRTPEAAAVFFDDHYLTYDELNKRSNQLARHLQALGVKSEWLVGLFMERSLEMVIGILGVLKAGGAYLPLDPLYPQERLHFMIEDAHVSILLTQHHLLQRTTIECDHIISLDADWSSISSNNSSSLKSTLQPENIAYVIYTSGSTGKPKGVMNTHQGICNRLLWMQDSYHLTEADRVLQKTSYSFDVSVWEFFWPLFTGATLIMAAPEGHRDSAYLVELIVEQQITTLHFVPSMLSMFLKEPGVEHCSTLKCVVSSGEALSFEIQEEFSDHLGKATLYNLYGPTEAAVDVTHWTCCDHGKSQSRGRNVPIGYPIANTQIYLLDRHLNPVPVGVPGELYIGGVGLARGYFNRPGTTAECFVPHPFSSKPGSRLYRSGDIARYLPDGCIEFLGRLDHQIKLRGFRIELEEIEAILAQHPLVQDVIAQAQDDGTGSKRLIAYVVAHTLDAIENHGIPEDDQPNQQAEQIMQWQQVFDETYHTMLYQVDPSFNIAGWNSSYTGHPLQDEEMREWVENTVVCILSLHPDRVLEIGCGTGLLLFRIAPHCSVYTGTDISSTGLSYIEQQLEHAEQRFGQVVLHQRSADDLSWIESHYFDTIILNSVIQYFPNADYLVSVIEQAIRLTKSGGHIFIGDVRDLRLIEKFHTGVELSSAPADMPITQLLQQVQKRIARENELVIDPNFFLALKHHLPSISHIELQLKRGYHHNELTRFRYDVILKIDHKDNQADEKGQTFLPPSLDWREQNLSIPRLRHLLQEKQPVVLRVANIPNARLRSEIQIQGLLTSKREVITIVDELRQDLQELSLGQAVDPEEIWQLSDNLPYDVSVVCSDTGGEYYDAVLYHRESATAVRYFPENHGFLNNLANQQHQSWLRYANNPLQNQRNNRLASEFRAYLVKRLPEYMIPTFIIPLETWPLTANGKVDRQALPPPDVANVLMPEHFIAPRTSIEHILVSIWSQVLGLERIGINHNFFSLGGDSILCIQIVSRAKQAGLDITPRMLFEHQTIASLGEVVQMKTAIDGETIQTTDAPLPVVSQFAMLDQQTYQQLSGVLNDIEDGYPLSPMQQEMLAQRHYTGNTELYWLGCAPFSMRGVQLDMSAYEEAWQLVVNQHPAMRTSFLWEKLRKPLQIVHKQAEIAIEHIDWRKLSLAEQQTQLSEYIRAKRKNGSDLSDSVHTHLTLFRMADHDYYLLQGFNYMLQDGWSSTLLERDFDAFYEALCEGKPISLEPPRHYRDYIAWLQKQDIDKAEEFWRKKLQGSSFPFRYLLGTRAFPLPESGSPFTKEILSLSIATTTALQALSRRHQMTVATFFYGAWALLLSRYSGKEDITFGCLCSGRPTDLAGSEYMVGFFNNILPLRMQLTTDTELLPWLQELQEQTIELREYEYTPMKYIRQWVGMQDTLPSFESYVVFENFPTYQYKGVGSRTQRDHGTRHVDIRKAFVPTEYPLRVEFWPFQPLQMMLSCYQQYASNDILAHMLSQMKKVLESMVEHPNQRLGNLMQIIDVKW